MAQSPTERVTALERMADVLLTRLDGLDKGAERSSAAQVETAKELATLDDVELHALGDVVGGADGDGGVLLTAEDFDRADDAILLLDLYKRDTQK